MTDINPFSDFDEDFQKTDAADIPTPGRVPPETYKFVCTTKELKKKGSNETYIADHEIFVANTGSKGFKLFCEILEPETVPNPKTGDPMTTKGVILERVFWGTKDNLAYMKRDLETILERRIKPEEKLSEILTTTAWAGRTFEGVVQDEEYPPGSRIIRSRIAFINPWTPPAAEGSNPHGTPTGGKTEPDKKTDPKADTKKTAAPTGGQKPATGAKATPQNAGAKGGKSIDF